MPFGRRAAGQVHPNPKPNLNPNPNPYSYPYPYPYPYPNPSADDLQTMKTCDNVTVGQMCEADGECNTDYHLNNCDQVVAVE